MSRIAIKLNKAGERAVKKGHPWIFEQSIVKGNEPQNETGALCIIFDQRTNKPFAFGLWDPEEIIRIKVFHWANHLKLSDEFWEENAQKAKVIREGLRVVGNNAYRAIHGENDYFPGLILDVYAQQGVLKIYSKIWLKYIDSLLQIFKEVFDLENIIIRFSRKIDEDNPFPYQEGTILGKGLVNERVVFEEYGVKFYADLVSGHKTGFFLDQRPNRYWVQKHARNKSVLDVFSYVGGFGIHALKGGAKSLTSVDISAQAMSLAEEQIKLNQLDLKKWDPKTGDAFEILNELIDVGKTYDIVIIDPPSFAKQASEVSLALQQYERLARLGKELVNHKGYLILGSCSSRIGLEDFKKAHQTAFGKDHKTLKIVEEVLHDIDHPILYPESNYLKTIIYQKS